MKRWLALPMILVSGCMIGEWKSEPAERPLTPHEKESREVSISGADADLATAVAEAMVAEGFRVVSHAPYHEELEVEMEVVKAPEGLVAVATVRSDGFFVEEARAAGNVGQAAYALARTLSHSQAMADFVRNNGVPQQSKFTQ
ncbi:MAG TPA: hypothetical protein VH083_03840 [Myxococcales bacterium]|nr:hypothetical protein [Myxococcales bacterium]